MQPLLLSRQEESLRSKGDGAIRAEAFRQDPDWDIRLPEFLPSKFYHSAPPLCFRFLAICCSRPSTDKGRMEVAKMVQNVLSMLVEEMEWAIREIECNRHVMINSPLSNPFGSFFDVYD
jgi:hypothetical protein